MSRVIILLSNDDGIHSEGLTSLEAELGRIAEIYTVAPDRAQSSMSHALTLHRPLRVQEIAPAEAGQFENWNDAAAVRG